MSKCDRISHTSGSITKKQNDRETESVPSHAPFQPIMSSEGVRKQAAEHNLAPQPDMSDHLPPQKASESTEDYALRLYHRGFQSVYPHETQRVTQFHQGPDFRFRTRVRKHRQRALGLLCSPQEMTVNESEIVGTTEKAKEEAIRYGLQCFDKACQLGDYEAALWLMEYYSTSKGQPTPNVKLEMDYFQRAIQLSQNPANIWRIGQPDNKRQVWAETMASCGLLEKSLHNGAIALVDHAWLVNYASSSSTNLLPSRQKLQELHPEAFVTLETLQDNINPNTLPELPIIALSYAWLDEKHPDPRGDILRLVAEQLKTKTDGRYGVFWDFCSLHNHDKNTGKKRSKQEEKLFQEGLKSLHELYALSEITVYRIQESPPGWLENHKPLEPHVPYEKRCWPFVEACWAATKQYSRVFTLKYSPNQARRRSQEQEGAVPPPLSLARFEEELSKRNFTNGKDDRLQATGLYKKKLQQRFKDMDMYNLSRHWWRDEEMEEVASLIRDGHIPKLQLLRLTCNKFGPQGCQAIANALEQSCPWFSRLDLTSNPSIGDAGLMALVPILPRLRELHLRNCSIADEGCHFLCDVICQSDSKEMITLDLSGNEGISDNGCDALGRMIRFLASNDAPFPPLRHLFLHCCGISNDAWKRLTRGVPSWNVS